MNNRNDIVDSRESAEQYIEKMVRNARKHGLIIQVCIGEVPMAGCSFKKVFPENYRHYDDCKRVRENIHSLANAMDEAYRCAELVRKSNNLWKESMESEEAGE